MRHGSAKQAAEAEKGRAAEQLDEHRNAAGLRPHPQAEERQDRRTGARTRQPAPHAGRAAPRAGDPQSWEHRAELFRHRSAPTCCASVSNCSDTTEGPRVPRFVMSAAGRDRTGDQHGARCRGRCRGAGPARRRAVRRAWVTPWRPELAEKLVRGPGGESRPPRRGGDLSRRLRRAGPVAPDAAAPPQPDGRAPARANLAGGLRRLRADHAEARHHRDTCCAATGATTKDDEPGHSGRRAARQRANPLAGRSGADNGGVPPLSVCPSPARCTATACIPNSCANRRRTSTLRSLFPESCGRSTPRSALYYLPTEGAIIETDVAVHYKNKPQNLRAIERQQVIRLRRRRPASGTVRWRYYPTPESGEHTARFLAWAMAPKGNRADPFHGAPFILQADPAPRPRRWSEVLPAPAHRAADRPARRAPSHKRARWRKGQDGRDQFRAGLALRQAQGYRPRRAERTGRRDAARLQHTHKVHSRTGKPRFDAWMSIRPDQLRVTPPEAELVKLIHETPVTRSVDDALQVRFDGGLYRAADIPGVFVGRKLEVFRSPLADAVYALVHDADGHERHRAAEDRPRRVRVRFRGPGHRPGIQAPQRHRTGHRAQAGAARNHRRADPGRGGKARKRTDFVPLAAPSTRSNHGPTPRRPDRLPRRGTALGVNAPRVRPPLTLTQFLMRLKRQHNRTLSPAEQAWLAARHPDGITEEQAASLIAELTTNNGRATGGRG